MHQLLVPGVFTPTEIQQAYRCGCRLVQLLSASVLGVDYWRQLAGPMDSLPFLITAGGLTLQGFIPWLNEGYDAVAFGRELVQQRSLDHALKACLKPPATTN